MSERILTLLAAVLAVLIAGVFLFWQPEIPDRVLPKANIAAGGDFTLQSASGPESRVTVKLDGRSFDFGLSLNSDTSILDAALQQGADLPYACKGGMCCTCKAKLLEGEVKMDVHWGLEEEEVANGFILTCQSHPVSEKVVVDFDIR